MCIGTGTGICMDLVSSTCTQAPCPPCTCLNRIGLPLLNCFAAVVSIIRESCFQQLIAAVDCIVGIVRSLLYTAVYNLDDFVTGTKFGVITHMEIPYDLFKLGTETWC